ncbi:MAG: hypothetical protein JO161_04670, partial [Planctomycetaceae bacterium]|nr:hypothetical protein [Planctomycetaceae bacterium]
LLLSARTNRLTIFGAGALVGLGYIWRIDTGVFALATVVLYLTIDRYYTHGYARGGGLWEHLLDRRALLGLCGDGLVLLLGLASALVVVRLAFGFPTSEWFWTSLVAMPRYHRDSTGLPLPLPWRDVPLHPWQSQTNALVRLPAFFLLALGLYATTLNKAVQRRLVQDTPRSRFFLMLLLFALFGLKTVMDRSSSLHQIPQGSSLLFALAMIDGLEILHWHRRRPRVLLGTLVAAFAVLAATAAVRPALLPRMVPPLGKNLAVLRASLQPTRTPEEMLALSSDPVTGKILQGVGQVRELLEAHKVGERQLLVYHSASQIYPLLNRRLPTKYYCLGWAADPVMEDQLISELEKNRVRAFLHVNGIGRSLSCLDVPDSYRIPRVHRYIASQEDRGERFETELGTLTILADP